MTRRVFYLVVAAFIGLSAMTAPARAGGDPAVRAIVIGSVPLLLYALIADQPTDGGKDLLTVGGGIFDAVDDEDQAKEFRVEYRSNKLLWKFKPFVGAAGTTDGGMYGYAGIRLDVYLFQRLVIAPSFAFVGYKNGGGKALGSYGLARSGFDVSFRFDDDSQIGIAFHHMSHGEVFGKRNPGTETLAITYSVPIDNIARLFR